MPHSAVSSTIMLKTEEDKKLLVEQYKVLVDSLNKLNEVRETANNFWTSVNGALTATLAYIRDAQSMGGSQKPFLLLTVLLFGFLLTLSWISALRSIKKSSEVKNDIIVEVEQYLPAKIFTASRRKPGKEEQRGSIALKEMLVPFTFLMGYIFFAVLLCLAPGTVIPT